jgi:hypothetical protein
MLRLLIILSLLGLVACATPNALPEDFNAEFDF